MFENETYETLSVSLDDATALIRLNRPDARNALNLTLRRELADVFRALSVDERVRAVVITGNEKYFAAGADIRDFTTAKTVDMYLRHIEQYWQPIADCPKPVIAAVNGYALGGGCELAMHADIIIAGENAKFGQPEIKLGLMPGAGGTQRLTRAAGKFKAMRLLLTGEMIDAQTADIMGLVSQVVEDNQVLDTALQTAKIVASFSPIAAAQIKKRFYPVRICLYQVHWPWNARRFKFCLILPIKKKV